MRQPTLRERARPSRSPGVCPRRLELAERVEEIGAHEGSKPAFLGGEAVVVDVCLGLASQFPYAPLGSPQKMTGFFFSSFFR